MIFISLKAIIMYMKIFWFILSEKSYILHTAKKMFIHSYF